MRNSIALAYELTSRALDEQKDALASLRSAAGAILAAASIAGSFLASGTKSGTLGAWGVAAMAAFALCSASAVWVLVPRSLVFAFRGSVVLREQGVEDVSTEEAYSAAQAWIEPYVESNRATIRRLEEWMTASCVLLAAEVLLWTVALAR